MLGGFDERYFLHVEDIDICRRARTAGGDVYFVPERERHALWLDVSSAYPKR